MDPGFRFRGPGMTMEDVRPVRPIAYGSRVPLSRPRDDDGGCQTRPPDRIDPRCRSTDPKHDTPSPRLARLAEEGRAPRLHQPPHHAAAAPRRAGQPLAVVDPEG